MTHYTSAMHASWIPAICAMLKLMRRRSPILLLLAALAIGYLLLAPLKQCADRLGHARPLNAHDCELALCFTLAAVGSVAAMAEAYQALLRRAPQAGIGMEAVPQDIGAWLTPCPADTSPPIRSLRI